MSTDPSLPPDNTPPTPEPRTTLPVTPVPTSLQATETGLTPNVAAGLAVLLTLISGIVFLLIEKRNQFVRYWAMQAIFFGGATVVFSIISTVATSVLGHIGWPLVLLWGLFSLLVSLVFFAVWIFMLVKAFNGKEWDVPYLGKLARQQLDKLPVV